MLYEGLVPDDDALPLVRVLNQRVPCRARSKGRGVAKYPTSEHRPCDRDVHAPDVTDKAHAGSAGFKGQKGRSSGRV